MPHLNKKNVQVIKSRRPNFSALDLTRALYKVTFEEVLAEKKKIKDAKNKKNLTFIKAIEKKKKIKRQASLDSFTKSDKH